MHFIEKEPSQKRIVFDEKLKSNKILRVPGAYNPLTAKLIEEIGYDAVYVSEWRGQICGVYQNWERMLHLQGPRPWCPKTLRN